MTELAKSFDPAPIEAKYGPQWEQRGLYKPTLDAANNAVYRQALKDRNYLTVSLRTTF